MKNPLVSIVIPTKNADKFLSKCLLSIKNQTYKNIETIIVDNKSNDKTLDISKKFKAIIYDRGPERAAQKNYGANKAKGSFIFFVDSDMELDKQVVEECLIEIKKKDALVVPERSVGEGFWNKCIILERECYVGDLDMEGYRFFRKNVFEELNGFDETLVASGEDLDISQKARRMGYRVGRINSFIIHHEGSRSPWSTIKKWRYYGRNMARYYKSNPKEAALQYLPIRRAWINNYKILIKDPVHTIGFMFLKLCNFIGVVWGELESALGVYSKNPYLKND